MLLSEIGPREPLDLQGYIAVPKGSLWQKDIHNLWVFDSIEEAEKASRSAKAQEVLDSTAGDYLVPIRTLNNIPILMLLSSNGYSALKDARWQVYAFSISEKSCRMAALKAAVLHGIDTSAGVWCYKTWNSDPGYFTEHDE